MKVICFKIKQTLPEDPAMWFRECGYHLEELSAAPAFLALAPAKPQMP